MPAITPAVDPDPEQLRTFTPTSVASLATPYFVPRDDPGNVSAVPVAVGTVPSNELCAIGRPGAEITMFALYPRIDYVHVDTGALDE